MRRRWHVESIGRAPFTDGIAIDAAVVSAVVTTPLLLIIAAFALACGASI